METCQGYLLDILEKDVEDAMQQGCERWMREDADVEIFGPAGAVALKYGVGVDSTGYIYVHDVSFEFASTSASRELTCVYMDTFVCA